MIESDVYSNMTDLHQDTLGGECTSVISHYGVGSVVDLLVRKMVDWPHLDTNTQLVVQRLDQDSARLKKSKLLIATRLSKSHTFTTKSNNF